MTNSISNKFSHWTFFYQAYYKMCVAIIMADPVYKKGICISSRKNEKMNYEEKTISVQYIFSVSLVHLKLVDFPLLVLRPRLNYETGSMYKSCVCIHLHQPNIDRFIYFDKNVKINIFAMSAIKIMYLS